METEREIIYSILNTARAGEHNNDENLSERFLRSILLIYRGNILRKYSVNGITGDDEYFQNINIPLIKDYDIISGQEVIFTGEVPKTIKLDYRRGTALRYKGYVIPILDSDEYRLSLKNLYGKHKPKAKIENQKITVYQGFYDECCVREGSETYNAIKSFEEEPFNEPINFNYYSILHNPSDDPNYDWENDPFPFPSERLDELKSTILSREFNLILRTKKDEIQNAREDNIRYHDNDDIGANS